MIVQNSKNNIEASQPPKIFERKMGIYHPIPATCAGASVATQLLPQAQYKGQIVTRSSAERLWAPHKQEPDPC